MLPIDKIVSYYKRTFLKVFYFIYSFVCYWLTINTPYSLINISTYMYFCAKIHRYWLITSAKTNISNYHLHIFAYKLNKCYIHYSQTWSFLILKLTCLVQIWWPILSSRSFTFRDFLQNWKWKISKLNVKYRRCWSE